jgi:hypothetical protein
MLLETCPVLETPALGQGPVDCRVYERKSCELPTTCQPASLLAMKEPGWSATIRDISQGGVRIDVPRRFEKGTPLAIEMPGNDAHETSVVFVNVVHIKRLEDRNWALGCRFVSELSEDELQRLLALEHPHLRDKIEQPQHEEVAEVLEIVENMVLSNVHFQIAIQRGCQISFLFRRFKATKCWPFAPGKIVRLNGSGRNQANWSLKIQLVACRQEADAWQFQAKLLQSPAVTDLLRALGPRS